MVTPELRGVAASASESSVTGRMLYAIAPGDLELEITSEVEGYVAGDHLADVLVTVRAEHLPLGSERALLPEEFWIYLRREPLPCPDGNLRSMPAR